MALSRSQSVNLRKGQVVELTAFTAHVVGTISRITVPAKGERVVEVEGDFPAGRVWVGVSSIRTVGR